MFYTKKRSKALRFGDILRGYCLTTPVIDKPVFKEHFEKYDIDVEFPTFSVMLSPCCQIKEKTISLTPLIRIRKSFFVNPYIEKDLTNMNRVMTPQQSVPPHAWEIMDPEKKRKRIDEGIVHGFVSFFIYSPAPELPEYFVDSQKTIKTGYYMIDFRNICKINCNKIITAEDSPLESKILELSVETRKELREKMASFYGTPAPEDKALED